MSSLGSVEVWLRELQEGHLSAMGKLHQRYWPGLVAYARARLRLTPKAWADEQDIVQSAFLSFYRAFRQGRVPLLASRENLLALLTTIIARKAARKARGPDLTGIEDGSLLEELAEESGDSPLEQALLNDCYQRFVGELPETVRPIAEMCLAGMTHREIAAAIPCAVRTVERKMARIMARWQEMAATTAE
jgi:RNA polymerase sigma factor (sigma-70 family)